mmetsp:Transcript_12998/g.25524  ORF Transcript_12998/g.25524 Transcript_12998/m.25524 type:complete len:268 (-) Transcript_12998:83-886(-)
MPSHCPYSNGLPRGWIQGDGRHLFTPSPAFIILFPDGPPSFFARLVDGVGPLYWCHPRFRGELDLSATTLRAFFFTVSLFLGEKFPLCSEHQGSQLLHTNNTHANTLQRVYRGGLYIGKLHGNVLWEHIGRCHPQLLCCGVSPGDDALQEFFKICCFLWRPFAEVVKPVEPVTVCTHGLTSTLFQLLLRNLCQVDPRLLQVSKSCLLCPFFFLFLLANRLRYWQHDRTLVLQCRAPLCRYAIDVKGVVVPGCCGSGDALAVNVIVVC